MFSLMPALGALLKDFIIAFFVLFDKSLQADISADLEPQMVELQEKKESGFMAAAVTKRMDAKEIQIKGSKNNKRGNLVLHYGLFVMFNQVFHAGRRIHSRNRLESNPRAAIGEFFNNFSVFCLTFTCIPYLSACQSVKI